ncbi:MAG: preprotein translocase subunit SecE [Puniceicoccales bacterium]|nr:preprotein translocase subunit SecE [Puniceicoccales bacterium]
MGALLGRTRRFFGETVAELRKTCWPTVAEFRRATEVVFMGALALGFFVALADFSLFQAIHLLVDLVR